MTHEEVTLWVQAGAVLVAIGASIVALVVSAMDRRNSRRIADEDRKAAIRHAHLMFEQEQLLRLAQNLRRGGHVDTDISKDMGAEAGAIIGALGRDRLPMNWDSRVEKTEAELRHFLNDENEPEYLRKSIEAQLGLMAVSREIRAEMKQEG